jgi:RNA polymerase sigma factor (sigma-70 family)
MSRESLTLFLRRWLSRRGAEAGGLTDAQLLERFVASRDEAAFEVLVWRHGPVVLAAARRLLRDAQAVEDVFQATFLVLVKRAKNVRRSTALGAWLYRVAYRLSLRTQVASARLGRMSQPALDLVAAPVAAAPDEEASAIVDAEIARLPQRYQAVVVLCYLEGLTTAAAARRLGCPRGTVLSRLATARRRLRSRLARRGLAPAALAGLALRAPPSRAAVAAVMALVGGGGVSNSVDKLVVGALQTMLIARMQWLAAAVLLIGLTGAGTGWWALRAGDGALPVTQNAAPAAEGSRNLYSLESVRKVALRLGETLREMDERARVEEDRDAGLVLEAKLQLDAQKDKQSRFERLQKLRTTERQRDFDVARRDPDERNASLATFDADLAKEWLPIHTEVLRASDRYTKLMAVQIRKRAEFEARREPLAARLRELQSI